MREHSGSCAKYAGGEKTVDHNMLEHTSVTVQTWAGIVSQCCQDLLPGPVSAHEAYARLRWRLDDLWYSITGEWRDPLLAARDVAAEALCLLVSLDSRYSSAPELRGAVGGPAELPEAWLKVILRELERARSVHAPMANAFEGYAVLLEEADELWDDIKANRDPLREAVQVGAMAFRFLVDVGGQRRHEHGGER